MCRESSEVRISNTLPAKQLLAGITRRVARLKEVSAAWTISGFGIRLSGHFHRAAAEVSERYGDDGR